MLAPRRLERVSEYRLQQTVVANAVKTLRQDVDEKTPDELVCCERHCRVLAFGPIVTPPRMTRLSYQSRNAPPTIPIDRLVRRKQAKCTREPQPYLTLDHTDDLLSFNLVVFDYHDPSKNEYGYEYRCFKRYIARNPRVLNGYSPRY